MKNLITALLLVTASLGRHSAGAQTITASGSTTLTPGQSVTLTASAGYASYEWTRNNVETVGWGPSYVASVPGYYRVKVPGTFATLVSAATPVFVRNAGSADQNRTQEDVVLVEGIRTEADLDLPQTKKDRTITYLDGLLRPTQQVAVRASPGNQDVVQFYEYNATGQQPRQYLPYAGGTDGLFKANARASQQAFYSASGPAKVARETATYAESVFEDAPDGRIIEQGAPGAAWQIAWDGSGQSTFQGHTKRSLSRTNTANEVPLFTYAPGPDGTTGTATFALSKAQTLSVSESRDEDGKHYTEYVNGLGQTVAKRTTLDAAAGQYAYIAYVYDGLGRTVLTLTPEGVKRAMSWEAMNAAFLEKWAYLYLFDIRSHPVGKKVPGREWMFTVYDRWDRPVASQDGNQRQQGKWAFVKYDELNRSIATGQISSPRTWQQLTADIESAVAAGTVGRYESKADNAAGTVRIGYTLNKSWPATAASDDLFTVHYYDDYRFLNSTQARLQYQQEAASDLISPSTPSTLTVGLPTISQTRILGSDNWLTSVVYYDDKARVIQSKIENEYWYGNIERFTTEYDYAGKTLKKYIADGIFNGRPEHTIRYRYTYYANDAPMEVFAWFDKSTGTSEQLLSKEEYNELGQVVDNKLGASIAARPWLQSVDYRYNIRGWLTHLNNRDLQDGVPTNDDADAEPDLFGLELKHNADLQTNAAPARYNGNIAESLWRSRRDNTLRGYAYAYDNANRLTEAKYSAWNGGWTGEKDDAGGTGRFTTSGIRYDLNGNLTSLNRNGQRTGSAAAPVFGKIDQLTYAYSGNRLTSVQDAAGPSAAPNDFEKPAVAPGGNPDDYSYDANGNMIADRNKGITVAYNVLDLPEKITFSNGNYLAYLYSAAGEKLGQTFISQVSTGRSIEFIDYVGDFAYSSGGLLTVTTPTGRALLATTPSNATPHWVQEYHIRDQLGSLRLAFREPEQPTPLPLVATMEQVNAPAEEQHFAHLAATRQRDPAHARTGDYAARLNAGQSQRMFGPSASVKVSAGDSVRFEVYGRYDERKKGGARPALVPVAVAANASAGAPTDGPTPPAKPGLLPRLAAGVAVVWTALPHLFQPRATVPRASVKYDFYDPDSTLVASQVRYLEPDAAQDWQRLVVGLKAKQAGYVQVSLQNATAQDVWFDDAQLRTTSDMIVQENHYDPWGQNLVNLELAGTPDCKQQYSDQERLVEGGLEWVDHGARYYDPQLGRWHVPDPADQFSSPYSAMGNNPVMHRDPDGRALPALALVYAGAMLIGGGVNVATHWQQISASSHGFRDGLVAFGIGAAAAAAATTAALAVVSGGGVGLGLGTVAAQTIWGGLVIGAAGAAVGSFVQGLGNAAYFGDPYSLQQWGTDVAFGAALGGATNAAVKGINFLRRPGARVPLGETPLQPVPAPATGGSSGSATPGELIFEGAADADGNPLRSFAGTTAGQPAAEAGSVTYTSTSSNNAIVRFGQNENQVSHAFRHVTKELGLNQGLVQTSVEGHFRTVSSQVIAGKPFNQVITVSGQRIQYTAFRLPDGTFNIGRIHGIK